MLIVDFKARQVEKLEKFAQHSLLKDVTGSIFKGVIVTTLILCYAARGRPVFLMRPAIVCVIRRKAAIDSETSRPPIPTEVGHPFRLKPATL
jgi:hypothetical protein